MKLINKKKPPQSLIAWIHGKKGEINTHWDYDDMRPEVKQEVKLNLIQEQGYLCCYTGRRIGLANSHIEHLKPQDLCKNHEDTEYNNLLAAYPSDRVDHECPYGAHHKKNWFNPYLFIHPLRPDCEKRFRFRDNGTMGPINPDDEGAKETIFHLNLNDHELQNLRRTVIHAALYEDNLSKGQVSRLMAAMDQQDNNGQYREFCFVIKQACERYLKR
jgi:uncharacterized protein (TIGR02646 family)